MNLDLTDKKILQIIQSDFPVVSQPFLAIAESLGIEEAEVLTRIKRLQQHGLIRRLGGLFDSRKIGYTGTLCAIKVPQEKLAQVADIINAYPGVTHNYLRTHEYNMWFTLLGESETKIETIINEIKEKSGITDILNLPAVNIFKVRVNFNLSEVQDAK